MPFHRETLEIRLAAHLASWLAGLSRRLAALLEQRTDGMPAEERRRFAAGLLTLRPLFERATTSSTLAGAIAELARLLSQFPSLVGRLTATRAGDDEDR